MFVLLVVASFTPVAVLEAGWWVPFYYGALLAGWVSVALMRSEDVAVAAAPRLPGSRSARTMRIGEAAGVPAYPAAPVPPEPRLIIVARDHAALYDRLRQDRVGDDTTRVIPDRRSVDRRRQLQVYIPERRQAERRRLDVGPLLLTQGWAQVAPQLIRPSLRNP